LPGDGQRTREIRNPADTNEQVASVREALANQIEAACGAAGWAFSAWRATPPPDRCRALFRYRELLEEHFEEIAALIVRESAPTQHPYSAGPGDV
jgi:malonate-semialdehyde dehydrogenase (acetylating)/methylmalonate-semialdehyde dehydrogenase